MSRVLFLLLLVSFALPSLADAQNRRARQAAEPVGDVPDIGDLESILPKLSSDNADEVREAIDLLSVIDRPEVIPHLATLLRSGQSDPITDRTLEALGGLAHSDAIEILSAFTHHRRPGARRRAFQGLAAIEDRRIPELLESGLSDSDRNVRATCALALGEIGARGSLDILFRAFERGVVEAAIAIGKLGNQRAVERFDEHLGDRPLAIMLSGYHEFLRRNDISNQVKTDIVARLGEVSGPMVRRFLQEFLGTFPERGRNPLKDHVEETLRRIPEGAVGVTLGGERGAP
jgi:HEAT repeat protein